MNESHFRTSFQQHIIFCSTDIRQKFTGKIRSANPSLMDIDIFVTENYINDYMALYLKMLRQDSNLTLLSPIRLVINLKNEEKRAKEWVDQKIRPFNFNSTNSFSFTCA